MLFIKSHIPFLTTRQLWEVIKEGLKVKAKAFLAWHKGEDVLTRSSLSARCCSQANIDMGSQTPCLRAPLV